MCQPRVCLLVDRATQYFMYSASQSEPRPAVPLGESANEYIELKPVQVCVLFSSGVCVCVCVRERERERECVRACVCMSECFCVRVCVWVGGFGAYLYFTNEAANCNALRERERE